jgi:phosphomannomutase
LPENVKTETVARLKTDFKIFLGRHVASLDRTDGLKMEFDDGSWALLRLSGTEPLMRVYTEAATPQAAAQLARETSAWVDDVRASLGTVKKTDAAQGVRG